MNITRLLESKFGIYIISVIIGLGIASMFRRSCDNKTCINFKGAPLNKIVDKVFKFNDDCYKYELEATKCDKTKKIITIEENEI